MGARPIALLNSLRFGSLDEPLVRRTMSEISQRQGSKLEFRSMQSFRPGRPQPTHRYAAAK